MGQLSPQISSVSKLFLPYFLSINRAIELAPKVWKEQYSTGELQIVENSPQRARALLKNMKTSKLMCIYLTGYFVGMAALCKVKNPVCTETKCVHDGNDCCEFVLKWDA
ncbi:MAG: hypothetical protein QXE27_05540 [Thermoplasmata archaeon]